MNKEIKHKRSQLDIVLDHLKSYKSISTWEGYERYGITTVSQRVSDLVKLGYDIRKEAVHDTKSDGTQRNYVIYHYNGFLGGGPNA